jgi:hypothetical protein
MTVSTAWDSFEAYDHGHLSANARPQRLFGGVILACVALACAWILWVNSGNPGPNPGGPAADRISFLLPPPSLAAAAYAKLSVALKTYARRPAASNGLALLFDASHSLGFAPGRFSKSAALQEAALQEDVSATGSTGDQAALGAASPAGQLRAPPSRTASLREGTHANLAGSDTPARKPTIFERLFGKPAPVTLAYAAPDDGNLGGQGVASGRYDRSTAVYDISAHTVYLPDGTKLEAHSGLGARLDDPRHADERMRGVTPPTVYDLKPRESLFHGVRALRLIPVDEDKVFGRSGLLAHSYMLGPNGDSNGCVSFKNYNAFLHAYESHQIKRLVVVTRLE